MAVSFVHAAMAAANNIAIPSHESGDLVFIVATRNSAAPGLPSGWESLFLHDSTNTRVRVMKKTSVDGEAGSVTSSAASSVTLHIYRGAEIGAINGAFQSADGILPVPGVDLENSDGSSWVALYAVHNSSADIEDWVPSIGSPAELENRTAWSNANGHPSGTWDTDGGVTSFEGGSFELTDSGSRGNYALSIEIRDASLVPAGPTLTSAGALAGTATTATVTVTTDTATGTAYCVVTTSATPPSSAQIKAGDDHTGTDAVWADDQAVSSAGVLTFEPTGLTAETQYYAYIVHNDGSDDSNVATAGFLTPSSTLGWTVNPAVDSVGSGAITITATPNQACEVHAIALALSATDVTDPASVVAGEDGDESPAAAHDSDTSAGDEVTLTLSGLTDPVYHVRVVAHVPDPE